jgi:glycine/D-amino acid oxidase-like deaminating enzyme
MLLYHRDAYDRTLPIGSYWETTVEPLSVPALQQSSSCEVAIIGGGLTGLSAALHLARDHGIEACVLEAGVPGWGASGRNGGFCCVGAAKLEPEQLLQKFGGAETIRFYQEQQAAVELVRELASSEAIAIDVQGEGEIIVAHHPSYIADLQTEYEFYKSVAGYPCAFWSQAELAEQGFSSSEAVAGLQMGVGFGLNPLKYSRGLAQAVLKWGGIIYAHSLVEAWEQQNGCHLLHTAGGTVRAKTVIIATNGYTEDRLHPSLTGCLLPALSQIITTRPLTSTELAAQGWRTETPIYDTHRPLFYYRLLKDGRLLFGSRGGTWGSATERERHRYWMQKRLGELFPAWKEIEITHSWNGFVCISSVLTPHIGQADDPTVFYGLAYHGSGVATSTWTGQTLANLVAGKIQPNDLCAVFRQSPQPFPLPALRPWWLRSRYWLYKMQDWLKRRY